MLALTVLCRPSSTTNDLSGGALAGNLVAAGLCLNHAACCVVWACTTYSERLRRLDSRRTDIEIDTETGYLLLPRRSSILSRSNRRASAPRLVEVPSSNARVRNGAIVDKGLRYRHHHYCGRNVGCSLLCLKNKIFFAFKSIFYNTTFTMTSHAQDHNTCIGGFRMFKSSVVSKRAETRLDYLPSILQCADLIVAITA